VECGVLLFQAVISEMVQATLAQYRTVLIGSHIQAIECCIFGHLCVLPEVLEITFRSRQIRTSVSHWKTRMSRYLTIYWASYLL